MATLTYDLIDGEISNRMHPDTFPIPRSIQRHNLPKDCYVKLGFRDEETDIVERMWVRVTSPGEGSLANKPMYCNMEYGQRVEFKPRHILDIMRDHY